MPDYGYTTPGSANGSINGAYYAAFIMPENGTLDSISINVGIDSGAARFALFAGGTSNTDPTGATLVVDCGLIPNGTDVRTFTASGQALTSGTRYWISWKSNDNASYRIRRELSLLGNFAAFAYTTTGETSDETVAYTSPVPSGTLASTGATYTAYITYTAGGGGGGGGQPKRTMHQFRLRV